MTDFGRMALSALAPTDALGLRKMGERTATLSVSCDVSQSVIKLAFGGLRPTALKPYVAMGSGGMVGFKLSGATIEGVPVDMAIEGTNGGQFTHTLELTNDSVVVFDTARLSPDRRKSYSVQMQFSAALPNSTVVSSERKLNSEFTVQVIDPK
ncbi:hypothetical protein [Burkholderia territorii]|uniref:hypothetical protein n=1 Tax=Burkholderia territorii TaxID=1503055 RepID=UPI0007B9927F|nr:hypothetical protein [Burkholderia territorii]